MYATNDNTLAHMNQLRFKYLQLGRQETGRVVFTLDDVIALIYCLEETEGVADTKYGSQTSG